MRPLGIDAIAVGRQLALGDGADARRLAEPRVDLAVGVAGPAGDIGRAFVELAAIGRIGEPVAAVGMGHDVVGRVELLALERLGQHRRRAVELVAHDAPRQVLARELAALEVEGVAVAVVGRRAEDADAAVVLDPAQLAIVGDVAPHEIAALRVPRRPFRPQRAGPQALDGRVGLAQRIEGRIDGDDVGIGEVDVGWRVRAEVARRCRDGGRRRGRTSRWRCGRLLGEGPTGHNGCRRHTGRTDERATRQRRSALVLELLR